MAGHGVLANPLRSALTILGVAIGVASIVSLMGIGEGARQAVVKQFKSLGANVIVIKALDPSVEFDPEQAEGLTERVEGLQLATPVVYTEGPMRWRRARGTADLLGVNNHFPEIRDHELVAGHFFTKWHVEQRSPVAVLGYNIAAGLLGGRSPVGQTFTLSGYTFRIIGVLAPKGARGKESMTRSWFPIR
jgi:putative ABC transport system permease protein